MIQKPKPKKFSPDSKDHPEPKKEKPFPIVGVGASAGGLPAFTEILSHLPQDPGLALVFIQHMDPTHVSQLPALLSRVSRMPVLEVKANVRVERDHVYLISPNTDLQISGGVLQLMSIHREEKPPFHLPIDTFLESLAKDQKEQAIGVILSGTGRDGAEGMALIKSAGGMAFVQDGTAQYPDMPKAAMATTKVDGECPCDVIAKELLRLAATPLRGTPKPPKEITFSGNEDAQLSTIFNLLREEIGTDFSRYKPATIQRRLLRRMTTRQAASLSDYIAILQKDKEEVAALHQEMLINLTGFFRDPEVFDFLKEKVVPEILKARASQSSIRVWVPACSTGEEVYSLAMILLESLSGKNTQVPIQIFGSDISEPVLEKARAGTYTEDDMAGVNPERRERFFVKVNDHYQITKSIRDLCVFAKQDLTRNPPFSKMDLISCRNLLIYLGLNLQNQVFSIFHYALNPSGFLMLGTAETIGNLTDLFAVIDKRGKIYSRKSVPHKLPFDILGSPQWGKQEIKTASPHLWDKFDLEKEANRVMIDQFVPPGVVVNEDMTILRFQGQMRPYLDPTAGGASLNLMKMVLEGLAIDLRILMAQVLKESQKVKKEGIAIQRDGKAARVALEIIPLPNSGMKEKYLVVLFQEEKVNPQELPEKENKLKGSTTELMSQNNQLRNELASIKRHLQSIIETEEASNQELRAANEEILSSNEEFQSTNEELETAKEELQSTNEELSTVNDELNNRNLQLAEANADLKNLFVSANLPIIMLSPDLRIRHFTPMAEKVMHLKPGDEGRSISAFKPNIDVPDLEELILECMKGGKIQEREVKDKDGIWYLLQIRSYRTPEGKTAGTIIAINIHQLKMAQEKLADANKYLETIIHTVLNPIVVLDADLHVALANDSFYRTFQVSKEETIHQSIYDLGNGQWKVPRLKNLLEVELHQKVNFANYEIDHIFRHIGRKILLLNASTVHLKEQGNLILLSMQDITQQKENALNIELQYEMIRVLSASPDLTSAAQLILKAICKRFGWQAGQLWVMKDEDLVPAFFWKDSSKSCPLLEDIDRQKRYKLKKNSSDKLGKEFHAERAELASRCGFQIPFVFLIQHGDKVFGAFELFSDKPLKIEKNLMQLAEILGNQIGQFIENKGAEQSKKMSEEIFRSSKLRQQFSAMTSHELRTPLTAIKEGINLVFEELGGPLSDEQKENLRISQNNVDRLGSLINNLLNLTRIDSDTFQVLFASTELGGLIKEICASMKQLAAMKKISLSCGLPREEVFAVCDAEKITQVIVNLVDNALKFTDQGGKITVHLKRENNQIIIQVSDTGIGIKEEDQQKVFDLFEQAQPEKKKKGSGFGIGLAICKKIVEQHQGQITLRSVYGEGSQFTVSFPANLTPSKRASLGEATMETISDKIVSPKALQGVKLLLAEDYLDNQLLTSRRLQYLGAVVDVANDGQEAVDKALLQDYDVILMDIQMPNLDGFEATKLLREGHYTKPIIALTAHAMKEEKERILRSGFDDYVVKPLDQHMLISSIQKATHLG